MGVLRYKIWSDLWANKGRTLQVVLIVAMGAAAIGMIVGTRNLVIPSLQVGWRAMDPAMINLGVYPTVNDDDLAALQRVEGVALVEGQSSATIEWRVSPEDEWSPGGLIARADYENQKLNKLTLESGNWPQDKVFAIGRGSETAFDIPERGQVYIRVNDREHLVQLGGSIHSELTWPPPDLGGTAQFYTTRDRYGELVGDRGFDQIMATTIAEYDEEIATAVADSLQEKLEKQDRDSFGAGPFGRVTDPNEHVFQDLMDGVFFLLGVLGFLALILGLLLVYNTINAIISQQVDQIGIMKAVGAKTGQVLRLYLTSILVYALLALLVALPLGIVGGWGIASWLSASFTGAPAEFDFSPLAIVVQIVIALLAPLAASLIPILSGARITVREAISSYGLSSKTGLLERMLAKIRRIPRLVLLTITNTFRNRWRVVLMQITLVLSGLIFMMVVSVRDSIIHTFGDVMFSILNYNISFQLESAERISHLEELTLACPDVKAVEMWGFSGGTIRLTSEPESEDDESVTLFGIPLPTELYGYQLRVGRWLDPDDTYAIVLNQKLAEDAGVVVGDWVTVKHGSKKETTWLVVGLLFDPLFVDSGQVSRDVMLREMGSVDRAETVWIQTFQDDMESEIAIANDLRAYYEQNHIDVSPNKGVMGLGDSAQETLQYFFSIYNIFVILLGIMAVVIGVVGSIGLSGALSLSVLERRREIGMMRAIGASSWAIARLFIGEGLILGWLSWLIALPFTIPAGQLMVKGLGTALGGEMVYKYTPTGAILWLIIITILSMIASLLPARNALRISVRESLAYDG
jgi:putative ABC transport system permease protein